ncbi:alpha/beta hydrolase [Spirillospora sp. NPDC048824]|uniref:alpha/beta hydrolase n=1 Tax=Spirillospora sp. NPDC048824 TaxID=3364526 RepID=UPI0037163C74
MSTLDDQTRLLLDKLAETPFPDLTAMEPEEMRSAHAAFYASVGLPSDPSLAESRDLDVPGPDGPVPVRIYRPRGTSWDPLPLLVYFHGGGMVAGSIDSYDAICRMLSHRAGAVVVSVGYRLAPEHRFPAAVDDSYAALKWAVENAAVIGADPARTAVGGDSSGGNLAAVVAQTARANEGPHLVFQLLVYPAVGTLGHSRSMARFATGYMFGRDEYDWLYEQYLPDPADARDPRVSPIVADLAGLPPALVITAGFDIMRDDGEAYAQRLREAGVPVVLRRYESTIHAFLSMAAVLDAGREAIEECAAALRNAFTGGR